MEVTFFIGPPPRARQAPLLPCADLENTPGPDRDVTSDTGERRDVTSPIEAGMGQGPRELEKMGGGTTRTGPPLPALRGGVPAASLFPGCPDSRLPSFCRSTQPPRGCSFHPCPKPWRASSGFHSLGFLACPLHAPGDLPPSSLQPLEPSITSQTSRASLPASPLPSPDHLEPSHTAGFSPCR